MVNFPTKSSSQSASAALSYPAHRLRNRRISPLCSFVAANALSSARQSARYRSHSAFVFGQCRSHPVSYTHLTLPTMIGV